MERSYMTLITHHPNNKSRGPAPNRIRGGMVNVVLRSLGFAAMAVSFIAGIIAIVPVALWLGCWVLANSLMDDRL